MHPRTRLLVLSAIVLPLGAGSMGQGCVDLGAAGSLRNDTALPNSDLGQSVDQNSPDLNPGVEPLVISDASEENKAKVIFKNETGSLVRVLIDDKEIASLNADETSPVVQLDCLGSGFFSTFFGSKMDIQMYVGPGVPQKELALQEYGGLGCYDLTTMTFYLDEKGRLSFKRYYRDLDILDDRTLSRMVFVNSTGTTLHVYGKDVYSTEPEIATLAPFETSSEVIFECVTLQFPSKQLGTVPVSGLNNESIRAHSDGSPGAFDPTDFEFQTNTTFASSSCGDTATVTYTLDSAHQLHASVHYDKFPGVDFEL